MNNNSRSEKKKLIASSVYCLVICVILVLSIIMFANGSMAWFANSNASNSSGMNISAEKDTDIAVQQVRILKYNEEAKQGEIITENINAHMVLNKYDYVFEERRINTAMILEITLDNIASNNFSVKINCTNSNLFFDDNEVSKIIENSSNIVYFKCATSETLGTFNDSDEDAYYQSVKNAFENVEEQKTFVNYEMTNEGIGFKTENKSEHISFNITREDANREAKIYVYINYDSNLVKECIERKYQDSTAFFSDTNLQSLTPDIESIIFGQAVEES